MNGITLYDGYQLPYFDGQEALQDVLDDARKTDHEEEAYKLSMTVCGGYGRTLVLTTPYWADRFGRSLHMILKANGVTLKALQQRRPAYRTARALT